MKPSKYSWETLVIAASFVAVWIYYLLRMRASHGDTPLSPASQLLLLPAVVLLVVVFVRRMTRVFGAMREAMNRSGSPPNLRPKK